MAERRVVITGIGAVTPLGASLEATLTALADGQSAPRPATLFDASGFACPLAAEVRDWDPRPWFRVPKALKLTDRPARFAVAAAQMALTAAGWPAGDQAARERLGIVIGSCGSDLQARDIGRALAGDADGESITSVPAFADRVLGGLNPLWLLVSLPNMTSAHVAIQMEARGPNSTIMSDWAAGHQAIGEAAEWIRSGEADAVLAGGADSGIQPFAYAAYEQAGLFDGHEDDRFVPGEGAAVFLLESHEAAVARGRQPYAELVSYSAATGDNGQAVADTICDALTRAAWTRESVTAQSRDPYDPRLGHALAAAAPIDLARCIATSRRGARLLSTAVGCSGEAVTLAVEMSGEPAARRPAAH